MVGGCYSCPNLQKHKKVHSYTIQNCYNALKPKTFVVYGCRYHGQVCGSVDSLSELKNQGCSSWGKEPIKKEFEQITLF